MSATIGTSDFDASREVVVSRVVGPTVALFQGIGPSAVVTIHVPAGEIVEMTWPIDEQNQGNMVSGDSLPGVEARKHGKA